MPPHVKCIWVMIFGVRCIFHLQCVAGRESFGAVDRNTLVRSCEGLVLWRQIPHFWGGRQTPRGSSCGRRRTAHRGKWLTVQAPFQHKYRRRQVKSAALLKTLNRYSRSLLFHPSFGAYSTELSAWAYVRQAYCRIGMPQQRKT